MVAIRAIAARASRSRSNIFDTTVVDTGVPRAARDDTPTAPKASEAPPFPHRYEAPEPKPPQSRPAVSRVPDMTEPKNIEADCGIVFYGAYTVTGGQVHVVDADGGAVGSLPVAPDDDIERMAKRLLRDKCGGEYAGRIVYPKPSIH